MSDFDLIVIGGGAGGCFAAIRMAERLPGSRIIILEAARKPLSKVEISGGGRCNVTHALFDPKQLIEYYPRGREVLLEPFKRFQPSDMVTWLTAHGVRLKAEADGRMFPVTDSSQTIIDCFMTSMRKSGIKLQLSSRVIDWKYVAAHKKWEITLMDGSGLQCKNLLVASGSDQRTWDKLKVMGHSLIPPVPSLFTFNIRDKALTELAGISMPEVNVSLPAFNLQASGPFLITHWGMSGPAILKLSAWGARLLHQCDYVFDVVIHWSMKDEKEVNEMVRKALTTHTKKQVHNLSMYSIPSRLWKFLCVRAGIPEKVNSSEVSAKQIKALVAVLTRDTYRVTGKSTFKEEFVTAGGVELSEVDMVTFESKVQPGLFFTGEVLNIDALTGGFNFQAAWTGADIAAGAIADRLQRS